MQRLPRPAPLVKASKLNVRRTLPFRDALARVASFSRPSGRMNFPKVRIEDIPRRDLVPPSPIRGERSRCVRAGHERRRERPEFSGAGVNILRATLVRDKGRGSGRFPSFLNRKHCERE